MVKHELTQMRMKRMHNRKAKTKIMKKSASVRLKYEKHARGEPDQNVLRVCQSTIIHGILIKQQTEAFSLFSSRTENLSQGANV